MLGRDAHDAVALRHGAPGDGGDGPRRNLDLAWSPTFVSAIWKMLVAGWRGVLAVVERW